MKKTCSNCGRHRDRNLPEPHLMCMRDGAGKRVDPDHTCPSWREPKNRAIRGRRSPV